MCSGLGLAVPVVEPLDPAQHADPTQVDLARARVEHDVVRLARPVGEVGQTAVAGPERVRDACPCGARDDVAGPHRETLEARRTPDAAADLDLVALVAE